MSDRPRTAILLSGGMDSIALAYWQQPDLAVTIDYGQLPATAEIQAASAVCAALGIEHVVVHADCRAVGSGDLAGVPAVPIAAVSEWWPFRNQLLVTLAAARVLPLGVEVLLLGTVQSDRVHADGTAAFIAALSQVLSLQEGRMRVAAPAAEMSSAALVKASGVPLDILAWAHSCHTANLACGRCRGCCKHFEVMGEIGIAPY